MEWSVCAWINTRATTMVWNKRFTLVNIFSFYRYGMTSTVVGSYSYHVLRMYISVHFVFLETANGWELNRHTVRKMKRWMCCCWYCTGNRYPVPNPPSSTIFGGKNDLSLAKFQTVHQLALAALYFLWVFSVVFPIIIVISIFMLYLFTLY